MLFLRHICVALLSVLMLTLMGCQASDPGGIRVPTELSEMVLVPEGEFIMGTSEQEAQELARDHQVSPKLFLLESPRRKVYLKAFWIDRFPVTNRQFREFLRAVNHPQRKAIEDRILPGTDDHPIVDIDYQIATEYAKWAGKRLPTDQEWEKAARGTDGRRYPWGNRWKESATHRRAETAFMPPGIARRSYTLPVGSFPEGASPYGVLDMCGNVAEYTSTPLDKGPGHVIKGARATCSLEFFYRCASVAFSDCDVARRGRGFRCVKDGPNPPPEAARMVRLAPRPLPPLPQPLSPREELYLKEPIRIARGPTLTVPYLPDGQVTLMAPESLRLKTGEPDQSVRLKETPYTRSEWLVTAGGTRIDCRYTFSAKQVSMHVSFESREDYVDYRLTLKNDSAGTVQSIRHSTCQCGDLPYFYDHEHARTYIVTDAGPQSLLQCTDFPRAAPLFPAWGVLAPGLAGTPGEATARLPVACTVSADGKWVRLVVRPGANRGASNANYCCIHLENNQWIVLKPGQEHTSWIRYYFLRGGLKEAIARYHKDFPK